MTELELLQTIGYAQDRYILDADAMPENQKHHLPKQLLRSIAAVLAIILALGLFLQTPVGAAAVETVKEQITRLIEILFPPKDLVIYVEGEPNTITHEALGQEPQTDSPGFAIYVDTDRYTMTQEGDVWFIRKIPVPIDREDIRDQESARLEGLSPEEQERLIDQRIAELEDFYAAHPPAEMEIREVSGTASQETAEQARASMEGQWRTISDIWSYRKDDQQEVLSFNAFQNDFRESHHFIDSPGYGCYHVIMRFDWESAEGGAERLLQMLKTFTITAPQDTSQYSDSAEALLEAMLQELSYAGQQDAQLLESPDERNALWLTLHDKLWSALEQTLDKDAMDDLMYEHLNWSTKKRIALTDTERRADMTRERVYVLFSYLEEAASAPGRPSGLKLSPNSLVEDFSSAYFRGDKDAVKQYLADSYSDPIEIYAKGTEVLHTTKGLDRIVQDMAKYGRINASIEFRQSASSDSYTYLSMTLVWEDDRWAVASFGVEG